MAAAAGAVGLAVLVLTLLAGPTRSAAQVAGCTNPHGCWAPASLTLVPQGTAQFSYALAPSETPIPGGGQRSLPLLNLGDQPLTLSYDGLLLTGSGPAGYTIQLHDPPRPLSVTCDSGTATVLRCPLYPVSASIYRPPSPPPAELRTLAVDRAQPRSAVPVAQVTYPAGWNLVAGPAGDLLTGVQSPLYEWETLPPGYVALPATMPLQTSFGYWAHFAAPTTEPMPQTDLTAVSFPIAGGAWLLAGNPLDVPAVVQGANVVLGYDPVTQSYVSTSQLAPGQGAWLYATQDGTITLTAIDRQPPNSAVAHDGGR